MLPTQQGASGTSGLVLAPRQVVFDVASQNGPWRVLRGLVLLDRPSRDGALPVMLAEPGDWLGIDALAGRPHGWRATCITPVVLVGPVTPRDEGERARWSTEALLQQPERAHAMALLRTGPIRQRLLALLRLLAHPDVLGTGNDAAALRSRLPPLRVLAELVDAKHETVCRVLAELLPRCAAAARPARGWANPLTA